MAGQQNRRPITCPAGTGDTSRPAAESPWGRNAQHGGPPAALLAHVIDQTVEGLLRIGRISADMLGSIPLREAVVEVSVVKPGRRYA